MNRQEYERETARDPTIVAGLQYYEATDRQGEYWRARPHHIDNPTKPVMKARLLFSEVNYDSFGVTGKRLCNGVMMPPCSSITQEKMKGKRFAMLSTREKRLQQTLKKVNALRPLSIQDSFDRGIEALKRFAESIAKANKAHII